MNRLKSSLLVAVIFLAMPALAAAAGGRNPHAEAKRDTALASLKTAVAQAIAMLEAKEYVPFIRRYVRPADMDALLKDCQTVEQCAAAFAEEKAGRLLGVLKKIKGRKPKMNKQEHTATFAIPGATGGKSQIIWEQVAGVWYIRN